jgi:hypothetical protein
VDLDRLRGDEERLRDLAVRRAFGRHLGDAQLARRERSHTTQGNVPGPRPSGEKFGLGARDEGRGAADRCQLDRASQLLARLGAATGTPKCRPQLGARLCVLELRG